MTLTPTTSRSSGAAGGVLFGSYGYWREQQASGTDAGGSTSGSWLTRVLNTEVFDPSNIGALAVNQVTVAAGTYWCEARAPFHVSGNNGPIIVLRIRDATNGATIGVGSPQKPQAASGIVDDSCVCLAQGRLVAAASVAIEVQYQTSISIAVSGLGKAAGYGEPEVYAELVIYKESA